MFNESDVIFTTNVSQELGKNIVVTVNAKYKGEAVSETTEMLSDDDYELLEVINRLKKICIKKFNIESNAIISLSKEKAFPIINWLLDNDISIKINVFEDTSISITAEQYTNFIEIIILPSGKVTFKYKELDEQDFIFDSKRKIIE